MTATILHVPERLLPQDERRLRLGAEHVMQLGARALAHLLLQVVAERRDVEGMLDLMDEWRAGLSSAAVKLAGADSFPRPQLRVVPPATDARPSGEVVQLIPRPSLAKRILTDAAFVRRHSARFAPWQRDFMASLDERRPLSRGQLVTLQHIAALLRAGGYR